VAVRPASPAARLARPDARDRGGTGAAHCAPFVFGGSAPDAEGDAAVQCPAQARFLRRAPLAYLSGLLGLVQRRPGGGDGTDRLDRRVSLDTSLDGAGVIRGDLTPECAAMVQAVLDALSAPSGGGDLRTRPQR
jgi:hypothetical protein